MLTLTSMLRLESMAPNETKFMAIINSTSNQLIFALSMALGDSFINIAILVNVTPSAIANPNTQQHYYCQQNDRFF